MNAQSYFIPKTKVTLALTLALVAPFCFAAGQEATVATDPASQPFEELPELQASEILKPEILKGPHHTVREPVPTFSGTNQFVIDSEYGVFEADGNEMLLRRVREVNAIAELKDISRGEQFTNALITAAKGPLKSAKNIIHDPAGSVSNMGKGAMKFMRGVGNSVKNVGKNKEDNNDREGSKAESLIGYSRTKRKIAINMGIDPYSTNTVLQHELEEVAWASWAGGFTFTAVTFPISGPVGVALTVTNVNGALGQLLHEKSPDELKAINGASLRAMGVNEKDIARLLNSDAFSPSAATAFVLQLENTQGRGESGCFRQGRRREVVERIRCALLCADRCPDGADPQSYAAGANCYAGRFPGLPRAGRNSYRSFTVGLRGLDTWRGFFHRRGAEAGERAWFEEAGHGCVIGTNVATLAAGIAEAWIHRAGSSEFWSLEIR